MTDTIAAIATAAGNASIGIVRISGKDAFEIADRIYSSPSGSFRISDAPDHTVHYGHIYDGDELLDEVLVTVFYAPRSFTGENVAEISCHGGFFVTRKILSLVIKNGARIAQPGEFTKRAFLNGRISLSQAEAVIDIINAKNDFALKNSVSQLGGTVRSGIERIRESILDQTAFIESALDDPEHYNIDDHSSEIKSNCVNILSDIEDIISKSAGAILLKDGITTLIIGKPNAGKSSLLNTLMGRERAIVTDVAGTTRDTIEESVSLDGIILNLIDTAGIRNSADVVERVGIDRTLSLVDKADLILYVVDASDVIDDNDQKIADVIKGKNTIVILNKSDITGDNVSPVIESFISSISKNNVLISAKTGDGIGDLRNMISTLFMLGDIKFNEELYITNERQLNLMDRARQAMMNVIDSIDRKMSEDFYTIDMMDAYEALGEIIGEQVSDDLADAIFEKFCMGK